MKKNQKAPASNIGKMIVNVPYAWQYVLLFCILGLTLIIYLPVRDYEFLNWDDDVYVTTANNIKDLSLPGIKRIFTGFSNSNYHPITTLSYALLYKLYGPNSEAFHLFNLFLHLVNILLVFVLLRLFFVQSFIALFGAGVFALHPMHVESVAWISEAKDLLYTASLLIAFIAYILYRRNKQRSWIWYILAITAFIFSCLSKSAAAILPLLLIAYDWYVQREHKPAMWLDKIPFFLLSIATGVLAIMSQQADNSISMAGDFPVLNRLLFAAYGLWFYILKFFLPVHLSALHYFPSSAEALPGIYYVAGLASLVICIWLYINFRKPKTSTSIRVTVFGFLFYLISLLMVLQLIPIGRAVVAERYTYLAYIGLILVIGYWILPWWSEVPKIRSTSGRMVQIATGIFFIVLITTTVQRIPVWNNSITLFDDVIKKYPDHGYAYLARGNSYLNMKEPEKALADYSKAILKDPGLGHAYYRRASLNYAMGRYNEAIPDIEKAVALLPEYPEAWNDRGSYKYLSSLYAEALLDFRQALVLRPTFAAAHKNAALALYRLGKKQEGLEHLNQAILSLPGYGEAYYFRGIFQWDSGSNTLACEDWQTAASLGYEKAQQKISENCALDTAATMNIPIQ